jgi:hypothetical protein
LKPKGAATPNDYDHPEASNGLPGHFHLSRMLSSLPAPQEAVPDELKQYFSDCALRIYRRWKTDDLTYDSKLSVLARIQILPDGTIDQIHLEEKSGDALFDKSVYNAIVDSSPLVPYRHGEGFKCINLGLRFTSPDKPAGDGPD